MGALFSRLQGTVANNALSSVHSARTAVHRVKQCCCLTLCAVQGEICGHFSCLQECLEGAVGSSVTVDMRLESALNGGELKCYCGHASLLPSHPLPSLLSPGDVLLLNHYSRSNALQALQYLQCTMCILQCAGCTVITLHFLAGLRCSCVSSSNVMEVAPRERRDLQHSLHGGSGRGLERNCSKGREKISGGGDKF